ncbi:54S ribosomal protein L9 [Myxozyma melibiosi]|uniref:Large ribosomal subunit protein uL3m n=1 Tax=Myxozyma melibiosi TaxID=54550 RepID=A0ABR1F5T0_9ASCO
MRPIASFLSRPAATAVLCVRSLLNTAQTSRIGGRIYSTAVPDVKKISSTIPILEPPPGAVMPSREDRPLPVLFNSPEAALTRKQLRKRPGVLAIKKGMQSYFTADGRQIPVTVLVVDRVQATCNRTVAQNGYYAVEVGAGARNPRNLTKPELGHLTKLGIPPKAKLAQFRVKDESGLLPVGTNITVDFFQEGQFVDIKGTGKGKGFSGVMKRHGFHGLPASHGVSVAHRSAGSTGGSQDPGRVLKGKKMAGRMGGKSVTTQNIQVVKIFPEIGVMFVKGPVPGPKEAWVRVQDALKKEGVVAPIK